LREMYFLVPLALAPSLSLRKRLSQRKGQNLRPLVLYLWQTRHAACAKI
jgi:hypothetical protein